jgi:serine/threonine protein kinase/Tfp pilus assembly protein PilF
MVGTTLGHYRIEGLLGSGGMGVVYRAFDTRLERPVAIKLLQSVAHDDGGRARLVKEARSASALNHPNICTVHEVSEIDGHTYIVMECIDGEPLSHLIPPGEGLSIEQTLRYGAQIADGLAHAHQRGVVHRDLKSANVVVAAEGHVKILDFGLARRSGGLQHPGDTRTMTSTAEVEFAGTPSYMAPEALRGAPGDERSDIWALGVVLYEMATGDRPFDASTPYELATAILRDPPAPLPPHVPPPLRAVISRCLSKEPEHRYQRASEVKATLDAIASGEPPAAAAFRHRRAAMAALAAIAASVLIAVIVLPRFSAVATPSLESIAVVPVSGATPESDYLSDGISEGVINALAETGRSSLRVIALASALRYKDRLDDPQKIGRELGVSKMALVRISRVEGALWVSAELVAVHDGRHLWGDRYNASTTNLVAVQGEITAQIATRLNLQLSSARQQRSSKRYTDDLQAYQLYLRGREASYRSAFGPEGYQKSIQFYDQAIARDPSYALAYSGLAQTYINMAYEGWMPPKEAFDKAKEAAARALTIDPELGELHYSLAEIKRGCEWNLDAAEREYRHAVELNPTFAQGRRYHASLLLELHRPDDAIAEMKKTLELDPLGIETNKAMGTTLFWAGRDDEAIAQTRRTVELDPDFAHAHQLLADIYAHKRLYAEAVAEQQRVLTLAGEPDAAASLGRDFAAVGYDRAMRKIYQAELQALTEAGQMTWVSPMAFAIGYAKLGNTDRAFEWLERAYAERAPWLVMLRIDPDFEGIRRDARFEALARRVGLP